MAKKNQQRGFLAPLTPKRWRRESRAMANLRYRPEIRETQKSVRASKQRRRNIRKMFGQTKRDLGKRAEATAGAYTRAGEQIGAQSEAASNYAEQLRQRMAQEAQSSANLRGTRFDPSGSNVNAQAQLARINAANLLRGVTASQGASQAGYMKGRQATVQRESVQQRLNEMQRARGFRDDIRQLKREKGEYRASLRPQAREAERQYHLGLLAARDKKQARKFAAGEAKKGRKFEARQAGKERTKGIKRLRRQNKKLQQRLQRQANKRK